MNVYQTKALQASPVTLLARVADENGNLITQGEIDTIAVTSIDLMTGTELGTTVAPSQAVFNTLQTDSKWTQDTVGYNLAIHLDGSFFPTASTYQVECLITPFTDEYGIDAPFIVAWQIETTRTYT